MQAKQDNHYARNLRQQRFVARQELAHFGGDRTQGDEDDAESQDEANRIQHDFAEQARFRRLQFLDSRA